MAPSMLFHSPGTPSVRIGKRLAAVLSQLQHRQALHTHAQVAEMKPTQIAAHSLPRFSVMHSRPHA